MREEHLAALGKQGPKPGGDPPLFSRRRQRIGVSKWVLWSLRYSLGEKDIATFSIFHARTWKVETLKEDSSKVTYPAINATTFIRGNRPQYPDKLPITTAKARMERANETLESSYTASSDMSPVVRPYRNKSQAVNQAFSTKACSSRWRTRGDLPSAGGTARGKHMLPRQKLPVT